MPDPPSIRTPVIQHWYRVRYQLIPVLAFIAAVGLIGRLWQYRSQRGGSVGEVETVLVPARSPFDGVLTVLDSGPLALMDPVRQGQVVARLDDEPAQAALEALKFDVRRLEDELGAAAVRMRQDQADRGYDRLSESRRLAVDVESLRLTILALQTTLASDKVSLARLDKLLENTQLALQAGAATAWEIENMRLSRDRVQEEIRGNTTRLAQAELDLKEAQGRQKAYPATQPVDVEAVLLPIRRARSGAEARVRELELQIASRTIRAPISGALCSILCQPGQSVRAGEDILVIAADKGSHIVTYVRQQQRVVPTVGMPVMVASRSNPSRRMPSQVIRVGTQIQQVPAHQCADPNRPEWGLPVLLEIPPDSNLRPGELVDIAFRPG